MFVYKIITREAFQLAEEKGVCIHESLEKEGFIHLSEEGQWKSVRDKHFTKQKNLLLLKISIAKLQSKLVYEDIKGKGIKFPHLYGPLNLDAVDEIVELD